MWRTNSSYMLLLPKICKNVKNKNLVFQSVKVFSSVFVKLHSLAKFGSGPITQLIVEVNMSSDWMGLVCIFKRASQIVIMHKNKNSPQPGQEGRMLQSPDCIIEKAKTQLKKKRKKTKDCTLQRFYLKWEVRVVFSSLLLLLYLCEARKKTKPKPVSPNYLSHRAQSGNLAQLRLWFIEPDDLKLLGYREWAHHDWDCTEIFSSCLAVCPAKGCTDKNSMLFWVDFIRQCVKSIILRDKMLHSIK